MILAKHRCNVLIGLIISDLGSLSVDLCVCVWVCVCMSGPTAPQALPKVWEEGRYGVGGGAGVRLQTHRFSFRFFFV